MLCSCYNLDLPESPDIDPWGLIMIVEQFLPAFHAGDAIGNSTWRLHEFLESKGIHSRIIALSMDESKKDSAVPFESYREDPDAVKILHFAIPSLLTDIFPSLKGPKVMIYHNITPPEFFVPFSAEMTRFTQSGREHLARMRKCFDLCVADSEYNAEELRELKYSAEIRTFPITIDLDAYNAPHSPIYSRLLSDDRKNIIFVGRISPNKKIEDLVKLLFYYKKYISPSIRLVVAGKTLSLPAYFYSVRDLAARFLLTSEDILFTGHIPFDELLAVYRSGHMFLSMSEHEGFCLPLIESCHFQIPVLAYDAGAVSETLAGAGVLFNEKKVEMVAGMAEKILNDESLRTGMRRKGEKRIREYQLQSDPEILLAWLSRL